MQLRRSAVFLINLVQDVNILRPLIYMASRDFGFETVLLVSTKFCGRDLFGIWQAELEEIAAETSARIDYFGTDLEARAALDGSGLLFAASESHLPNHVTTHAVFRYAPPTYLKITLQHGFECIGFKHSADHIRAHGATASFGADIVCAWQDGAKLYSMAASQRPKLLVTGPTAVLQQPSSECLRLPDAPGIVCENLHSVRLNSAGDFKGEFVEAFAEFCDLLDRDGRTVVLRPHPGGQYVLKNGVPIPKNAKINNAPMYRTDLRSYGYGISAPSSVLIDMLLAEIPTAVWRDVAGGMDTGNYDGLASVSSSTEWLEFSRAALADPGPILEAQQRFLDQQTMPLDPAEVFGRYAELFYAARRMDVRPAGFAPERERLLFVANSNIPTLQLSFEKPLAPLVANGVVTTQLLTEADIRNTQDGEDAASSNLSNELDRFDPSAVVFCRYSGPGYDQIIDWSRANDVPSIYHIDDDLLGIPPDIGEGKFKFHNDPERTDAVRYLLTHVDQVYASTEKLRAKLQEYYPDLPIAVGVIYCSGEKLRAPRPGPARKFGYMASADHAHNLAMVLSAIERALDKYPQIEFELFGSIPIPSSLERFGARVISVPPVADYSTFLESFAEREWDIGICPLVPIEFNMMKANTKWVEYTSAGVSVIASRGTVYDDCCDNGCGILAATEEEWFEAISTLIEDDEARVRMTAKAQAKLGADYNIGRLRTQVLDVIELAKGAHGSKIGKSIQESSFCQTA